jgi:hypothetical protein
MANPYSNTVPAIFDARVIEGQSGTPRDLGWQMASLPVPWFATSTFEPMGGSVYLIPARAAGVGPISTIFTQTTTAGATLTAAQNLVGLYQPNAAGVLTLIAQSLDFSTKWAATAGPQTQTLALTGQTQAVNGFNQISLVGTNRYYFGLLSVGMTTPVFAASPVVPIGIMQGNSGLVVANVAQVPFTGTAVVATSATALPGSINLGTATVTPQSQTIFVGAY